MVFHKTREQGEGVEQTGPLLLFRVHIHTIYTGFTHFCREISLVAITRFGRQFWAKYTQEIFDNIYKALEIFDCFGFLTLFPLITCASWALAATNPATSLEKYS